MKKTLATLLALLALAAPAAARETLTIYTYDSFVSEWGPGAKIKEAFEKDCDCAIEWVAPGDGVAVLNRLKLEGANTQADVVLGNRRIFYRLSYILSNFFSTFNKYFSCKRMKYIM